MQAKFKVLIARAIKDPRLENLLISQMDVYDALIADSRPAPQPMSAEQEEELRARDEAATREGWEELGISSP